MLFSVCFEGVFYRCSYFFHTAKDRKKNKLKSMSREMLKPVYLTPCSSVCFIYRASLAVLFAFKL